MSRGQLTAGFFECGSVEVEGNASTAAAICDASQSAPSTAPTGAFSGPSAPKP